VRSLLAAIDHAPSRAQVMAERALLAALGGACHSPVAVLTEGDGETLAMRAAIFSQDGAEKVEGALTFAAADAEAPARLAADLLARASEGVAALFHPPA
jgi:hydroxymethylbilane synthase